MNYLPPSLQKKLLERSNGQALRSIGKPIKGVDFSSNDYLGFTTSETIYKRASRLLNDKRIEVNGASGSRLLTGNHGLYQETEAFIAQVHKAEAALLFNSGYDANLGFLGCVPQRGDVILYDELSHASIRDGIAISHAKAYKFRHNSISDLERLIDLHKKEGTEVFVVTEAVFSMDGDCPDLVAMADMCQRSSALLIVDEAHAVGVIGNGLGSVQEYALEIAVFARIVTFGKALGCHGAAVLGSTILTDYLINFARSFIYTTALPPHSVATVQAAYEALASQSTEGKNSAIAQLQSNIILFRNLVEKKGLSGCFMPSESAIHSCLLPGNKKVKAAADTLQKAGFDVRPILSPTVPSGKERLRFCIHSFNSKEEMEEVLNLLATFAV
ncbi:aminotransferase class I/II-fold pyridoxal phosphate-dependent enzyme [Altibacter sp.]|uniref:aminotransferase class I/II-fold pyridoxal phosphate-dependent enzyme n=1 Tax=Altibacter sp. TaxID=2024823 RepID=UPI000C941746|nr:aminotransferase class I/II-fold pyridoxal phosphate-dependent enzyme [Altibacter sp.]MAP53618.1 8-amino-7-oxononanoate synthase [Altibacter sp.]|tara:strand:- start:646 stop:1803 length:1158 start_codon:yes stop_codon:yes gene_type:complete